MDDRDVLERIESRRAFIAVVGAGYVGLTVAASFARAGFSVVVIDRKPDVVARIEAGVSPIVGDEPGLGALVAEVVASKRLVATTSLQPLAEADVVVIAVETPIDPDHRPRYAALEAACRDVGRAIRPGVLVVVESTVSPGTCERRVTPILEETSGRKVGDGVRLGHCPERVMPGLLLHNLRTMPRVCGANDASTRTIMAALYRTIVDAPIETSDLVTAEIVKTAENTWRDVNIALANEIGKVCEAAGADFDRVRALVNQSPGRALLIAGAGVGGACIPKDPWLLVEGIDAPLVAAARAVNDAMPLHVASLVVGALEADGGTARGARVVVLGVAYLANSASTSNSPTAILVTALQDRGVEVTLHDPWIAEHGGDVIELARGARAAVLMVAHDAYRSLDLEALAHALATPILVDGRRAIAPDAARRAGLRVIAVGRG